MENEFQSGEFVKMDFQRILTSALSVLKSKPFVNIDLDELSLYARLIQYRVQRDLYEVCIEESPDSLTWKEFVFMMRAKKQLREKSVGLICRKLETAFFDFDFTAKEINFLRESDEVSGDTLRGALLFPEVEGILVMSLFLYFAEQAHFQLLQNTVRSGYTWEEYFSDLQHGGELWQTLLTAFRDAIQRLDFKDDWRQEN